jgi:hypothetical protein
MIHSQTTQPPTKSVHDTSADNATSRGLSKKEQRQHAKHAQAQKRRELAACGGVEHVCIV